MRHYVNCRYCSSIGSEKLCSSCSLEGENLSLPPLKDKIKVKRQKPLTPKQIAAQECFSFVKSLKTEEIEY